MLSSVKKAILGITMVSALMCGSVVVANAESDTEAADTFVTQEAEVAASEETAEESQVEENPFDKSYIIKAVVVIGLGIAAYAFVTIRSRNN